MRKFSRLVMRGGTRGRARRSRCFKDGKEGGSAATRILAGTCMQCLPAARKVPTRPSELGFPGWHWAVYLELAGKEGTA